ncbi:uncharacterized protein LOC124815902 isoform X1 [Hydra vulgaris]|uniref:uncharacterized protein LOC124815902 isoform X1 n=1 Tax=Hydra vulgaris TaxID=6087 RepID=UPI001F5F3E64|nr:uncharacterized protein LOC124815902 [Hydra vulgaris]
MESIEDCDAIKKLEDFKLLTRTDERLRTIGSSLLNKILSRGFYKWHPNVIKNIALSGSCFEGAVVARFFKKNSDFDDELNRELEIDIEFTTIKINSDLKHYVEDISDKYGFVKVRADLDMLMASNIGWDVSIQKLQEYLPKICTNGYLQPFRIKKIALEKAKLDLTEQRFGELFFAIVYNAKISEISTKKTELVTNASFAAEFYVQVKNKNVLLFSYDFVILFEIGWWPDIALEWKNRARKWPKDQSLIDELTKSCFIIAKSNASDKFDTESYTWRYSFSNIERVLISMRSSQQNLIYLIFKAMFYKWIKPISSTHVFSFVAKNIMLKACEDYPPQHQMWNETYKSTKEALIYLFLQAYTAYENGKLEYYFINKINVIESVDSVIKEKIKAQILSIINNFEMHFFLNVSQVNIVVEDMVKNMNAFDKILNETNNGDYSDFLNLEFLIKNFDFLFDKSLLSLYKDLTNMHRR